jgi:hypothetical protein
MSERIEREGLLIVIEDDGTQNLYEVSGDIDMSPERIVYNGEVVWTAESAGEEP